jgi:hypothetical protein
MDGDSRTLLITVGGLWGGSGALNATAEMGMPPFELFKATATSPCKRLFVRDLRQSWYHKGLPGHGKNLLGVAETLRERIADHDIDRLVVAGNSAGGYGALVFGTLLGADVVLGFGAQTVLNLDVLGEFDDHRYDERLGELFSAGALDPAWTDLRTALAPARVADTRYRLYFDNTFAPDRLHAERLRELEGVRLYRLGRGGHSIARAMRETGALERVLHAALATPA